MGDHSSHDDERRASAPVSSRPSGHHRRTASHGPILTAHSARPSSGHEQRTWTDLVRASLVRQESLAGKGEERPIDPANTATRHIVWNKEDMHNKHFCGNAIHTGKYDQYFITFVPLFLFDTFTRVAYIYFLLQASLAWWEKISPFSPYGPTAALTFVLLTGAVKAIVGDRKRHVEDRRTNNSKATIMKRDHDGKWHEHTTPWHAVNVGDMVKVRDGELFPADLLCLHCNLDDRICYVVTTNLDGETNLKVKRQLLGPEFYESNWSEDAILDLSLQLECEHPSADLISFRGRAVIEGPGAPAEQQPIQMTQLLLRGCKLRNSGHVLGLVIYTGKETRIQQNSAAAPRKIGAFDYFLNIQVFLLILVQMVLCSMLAGLSYWWREEKGRDRYYLAFDSDAGANPDSGFVYGLLKFLTFWILLSYLIPNSLFVTIEIVKFVLGFVYINSDPEMVEPGGENAQCRNANLTEDLGKIDYIFSDKTGTLTSNEMRLRAIAVKGRPLGDLQLNLEDHPELTGDKAIRKFSAPMHTALEALRADPDKWQAALDHGGSPDPAIACMASSDAAAAGDANAAQSLGAAAGHFLPYHLMDFWLALALCHGLLVEESDPEHEYSTRTYQGPSPDEVAIVDAARQLGFEYLSRSAGETVVRVLGTDVSFETIYVNEFTSERARMSVIVRCPDGTLKLLVKGSDVKMMQRLKPDAAASLIEHVQENLYYFSTKGLRTLVVGVREIDEDFFEAWEERFRQANNDLVRGEELVDKCLEELEKDLDLIGITAVEDKLQQEVPESIATLLRAGIKFWMITGDKQETAINIAVACRLFGSADGLLLCNAGEDAAMDTVERLTKEAESRRAKGAPVELVVDGKTLKHLLGDPAAEEALADMGALCTAVCVCRASPSQKAGIVSVMRAYELRKAAGGHRTPIGRWIAKLRRKMGDKSLAIGDGANDVAMIQVADIGVGIAGKEGRQAANNSDFIISQFRFLVRLLLVHGHLSHFRLSRLIKYFFYKNAVFAAVLFYYQFFNGFSGQAIIDGISASTYNVLFSSIPPFFISMLDRPTRHFDTLSRHPRTYNRARSLTTGVFLKSALLMAFIDGAICFFIPYLAASPRGADFPADVFSIGKTVYICMLGVVNIELMIVSRFWTRWFAVAVVTSILIGFPFLLLYSLFEEWFDTADMAAYGMGRNLFGTTWFWVCLLSAWAIAFSWRFSERSAKMLLRPDAVMVRAEIEEINRRDAKKAAKDGGVGVDSDSVSRGSGSGMGTNKRIASPSSPRDGAQQISDAEAQPRGAEMTFTPPVVEVPATRPVKADVAPVVVQPAQVDAPIVTHPAKVYKAGGPDDDHPGPELIVPSAGVPENARRLSANGEGASGSDQDQFVTCS